MFKSIAVSKRFENTYNINSFLYKLSKLIFVGKFIDDDIYSFAPDKRVFSIFITIYGWIRSLIFKLFYFFIIYYSVIFIFKEKNLSSNFIHVFITLTILGIFINTRLFIPGKKNYYSINLLGIDSRIYTFGNLLTFFISGFILNFICLIVFKNIINFSYIYIFILTLFTSCSRIISESFGLLYYKYRGNILINNERDYFIILILLLLIAYLFPYLGIVMDINIVISLLVISIILVLISINCFRRIDDYKIIYKRLSTKSTLSVDSKDTFSMSAIYEVDKKDYKIDEKKLEGKIGYDYFNTIFFLRHKKILMTSAKNYSIVMILLTIVLITYTYINSSYKDIIYNFINNHFTWTLFIMYFLNRGAIITGAMFYNCDRSMLKYNFYREESVVLNNFKTRVKTVVKVNLIPAIVFSVSLVLILFLTGGLSLVTYISIFISIIIMSILFSIHYLAIYYLLQPYDDAMSMKSFSYSIVSFLTYLVCYICTKYTFSIINFNLFVIILTIIYVIVILNIVKRKAFFTFCLK